MKEITFDEDPEDLDDPVGALKDIRDAHQENASEFKEVESERNDLQEKVDDLEDKVEQFETADEALGEEVAKSTDFTAEQLNLSFKEKVNRLVDEKEAAFEQLENMESPDGGNDDPPEGGNEGGSNETSLGDVDFSEDKVNESDELAESSLKNSGLFGGD